jgi:hypothetical protein
VEPAPSAHLAPLGTSDPMNMPVTVLLVKLVMMNQAKPITLYGDELPLLNWSMTGITTRFGCEYVVST